MSLEALLKYPVVLLTGAIVGLLLTRAWGPRAARWGFVDHPGPRKVHRGAVPTAGGIALFLAFHCACALVFLYPWKPFAGQLTIDWWLRFLPLSAAVVALGLADDRFALKPLTKLAGQGVIAVAAYLLNLRVQNVLGASLPLWLDVTVTIAWILILMNAFNLIDGIDGLAVGIALIAALGIALSLVFRKLPGDVLLFLGFAGACAGFLRYNFHPARVFLGDTGSLFVGFTLAVLAISTSSKGTTLAVIGVPLLAVGIPLFDTLLAVWRRSVRRVLAGGAGGRDGRSGGGPLLGVEQADAEHLHHRLLRGGRRHSHVALLLYAGTAALVAVGLLASLFHDRAIGILALAFLVGAYMIVRHLAWIELQDTGEAILRGIAQPVRRNRAMLYYLAVDLLILHGVLLVTLVCMQALEGGGTMQLKRTLLRQVPMDVGLPFLFLVLFRSYSRVWYLARVSEFMATGLAVVLGYAVACALSLTGGGATGAGLLRYWLMAGLAAPLIVAVRALRRVVQDLVKWLARDSQRSGAHLARALVYGTGYRTTLFLRQRDGGAPGVAGLHLVGLVDSDDAVRGHYVHGLPVLGNLEALPRLLQSERIEVVYIIEDVDPEGRRLIEEAVRGAGAHLKHWEIVEHDLIGEADAGAGAQPR